MDKVAASLLIKRGNAAHKYPTKKQIRQISTQQIGILKGKIDYLLNRKYGSCKNLTSLQKSHFRVSKGDRQKKQAIEVITWQDCFLKREKYQKNYNIFLS